MTQSLTQQFVALQKAAHARVAEQIARIPQPGSVLKAAAYEVLSDAIAALPLDSLAGEPALEPVPVGHKPNCAIHSRSAQDFLAGSCTCGAWDSPNYAHPIEDAVQMPVDVENPEQIGNCEWCGTALYRYEQVAVIVLYDPERTGQFDKQETLRFCSLKHKTAWQEEHPAD